MTVWWRYHPAIYQWCCAIPLKNKSLPARWYWGGLESGVVHSKWFRPNWGGRSHCDQNQSGFYLAIHGHGLPHQIQLQLQAVDSRVRSRIISWQSDFQISNIVSDFSPRQGTSLHGHGLRAACAVQSILKKTDLTLSIICFSKKENQKLKFEPLSVLAP